MKKNKGVLWLAAILLLAAGVPLSLLGLFISRIGSEVDNSQISETVQAAVVPSHSPVSALPSPSPSPTQIPTSTPISTFTPSPTPTPAPVPTSTENPYSVEQFAMLYDGATLRYATVIVEGISDIPPWLRIDAYIDNGVEDFDICAPVDDNFETNDVPVYSPSQFVLRFSFEIDSSNLDGDLIDYSAPETGYVEFVLDAWSLDEYEDGNLHGTIEETFNVYYIGMDGEDHMEEAYFCPEITVQLQ